MKKNYVFKPVGYVRRPGAENEVEWSDLESGSSIEILPEFAPALLGLKGFSHIIVFFVFHKIRRKALFVRPEDAPEIPELGVFSTCSPLRPNPLGMTVVKLASVRKNVVRVRGLDALDGTPVVDIKPFFGFEDETAGYRIPRWIKKLWEIHESEKKVRK